MEYPGERLLVVLTATADCYYQVDHAARGQSARLIWIAYEPSELFEILRPTTSVGWGKALSQLVGIVIDMTRIPPQPALLDQVNGPCDVARLWSNALTVLKSLRASPLFVIGTDLNLGRVLDGAGFNVAAFLSLDADGQQWRIALEQFSCEPNRSTDLGSVGRGTKLHRVLVVPTPAAIQLGPQLWFEPDTCALLRRKRRVALTARECLLLRRLVYRSRCYHSADSLARYLTRDGGDPVSPHSVEQTISGLRSKLGDSGAKPRLLLTRRGIGYGLFPTTSLDSQQIAVPSARSSI